jgi:holo-[acyl-carrier protein] synthase
MRIIGHGIDLVDNARLAGMIESHGQHFLDRVYSPAERALAQELRHKLEYYSGRFAAKEAVLKALGTGLSGGISWTEIEVLRAPSGRPVVQLSGRCLEAARGLGVEQWQISISHISTHATASAIAMGLD